MGSGGALRNPLLRVARWKTASRNSSAYFADQVSTESLRANQLRLYFSSLAYVLVHALRRLSLAGTQWAYAQVPTVRLRLLKIAAEVRLSVRPIWVSY
jgi:hypothetical protein